MSACALTVLGDSFSAGWADPDPKGGYRGWVWRFAQMMNLSARSVRNLAEYGASTQRLIDTQLPIAVRDKSPLVVAYAGVNDLLCNFASFDSVGFQRNLNTIFDSLVGASTTVVTATYPNIPANMEIPDDVRRKLSKRFVEASDIVEETADSFGVMCVDLCRSTAWRDAKIWSNDRLHPNSIGHRYFAEELVDVVTNAYGLVAA